MLLPLLTAAAFALQLQGKVDSHSDSAASKGAQKKKNTNVSVNFGVGGGSDGDRRPPRRIPVTAQHLATAFRDPAARTLLLAARLARMAQDSALTGYDATAYQRISAGLGFSAIGRDRLAFRTESVARVQWQRNVGAWVELKGRRTVVPIGDPDGDVNDGDPDMEGTDVIPYYPGYEPLFIGGGMAKSTVDEREMVHPLAEGAEAYYQYESGDSVSFRLPDGKTIQLRELRVRPREPKWNVAVGSLWFDASSGQLVRAAFRLAVPLDVWTMVKQEDSTAMDDVPIWVKPMLTPMHAQVKAIAIEYGLHLGRFWLLRLQAAEGDAQVSFMHVPFKMERSFRYASVNAPDTLPAITLPPPPPARDSATGDSAYKQWRDSVRHERVARRDSIKQGLVKPEPRCDAAGFQVSMRRQYNDAQMPLATRVPCDEKKLENSPDLPKSIYDDGEEIFGAKERAELMKQAVSLGAQPDWSPQKPVVRYGLEFTRYNRIEGLSTGVAVDQQFGAGYSARVVGRIGLADLDPNVEATFARSDLTRTLRVGAYNHLVSASDWGNPLSFGSSLSALLFGRDEGYYYRSTGVELGWNHDGAAHMDFRVFAERQRSAKLESEFSLSGHHFLPNLTARAGNYSGAAFTLSHSRGLDPRGLRIFTDLRLEGASGDSSYGRGALDMTVTHSLMASVDGALRAAGGTSVGALPAQRLWYLGGSATVRGQSPDLAQSGNAFWLTRAELGRAYPFARPIIFGDLGWAGDRTKLSQVGRPLSGVGVGASFMDGLVRADVSRGIYPRRQVKFDLYVEAKF